MDNLKRYYKGLKSVGRSGEGSRARDFAAEGGSTLSKSELSRSPDSLPKDSSARWLSSLRDKIKSNKKKAPESSVSSNGQKRSGQQVETFSELAVPSKGEDGSIRGRGTSAFTIQPDAQDKFTQRKELAKIYARAEKFTKEDGYFEDEQGEFGDIHKIINAYHDAVENIPLLLQDRLTNLMLGDSHSGTVYHQFHKTRQLLEKQHDVCMEEGNVPGQAGLGDAYKNLTHTLLEYHQQVATLQDHLAKTLDQLAPQGFQRHPPDFVFSDTMKATRDFICENLAEICQNPTLDQYPRNAIISEIGRSEEGAVSRWLIPQLSNKEIDEFVRSDIAEIIGTLNDKTVVRELVPLLSNEKIDWWVRSGIAGALGTLGDETVVRELIPLLSNKTISSWVRGSIAETIGELGDETVIRDLTTLHSSETISQDVRSKIGVAVMVLNRRNSSHE